MTHDAATGTSPHITHLRGLILSVVRDADEDTHVNATHVANILRAPRSIVHSRLFSLEREGLLSLVHPGLPGMSTQRRYYRITWRGDIALDAHLASTTAKEER